MALKRRQKLSTLRRGLNDLVASRKTKAAHKELFQAALLSTDVQESVIDHLEADNKVRVRRGDGTFLDKILDFLKYLIENPEKLANLIKILLPLFMAAKKPKLKAKARRGYAKLLNITVIVLAILFGFGAVNAMAQECPTCPARPAAPQAPQLGGGASASASFSGFSRVRMGKRLREKFKERRENRKARRASRRGC